jgi:dipeptidyl aminopeptidase/acylaminoacyl peptidase
MARHLVSSAVLGTALLLPLAASAAPPELLSVKKIWDAGKHNAFTDLIRWHDKWYCTFREADGHVGGDGKLQVLVSDEGDQWQSAALISEAGIDLRDPKLSITPDGSLMVIAGGSVYEGKTLQGRQPRVTFSKDGRSWSAPQRVLEEGEWLWRVTWHDGKAYGISYNAEERTSAAAQEAAKTGKVESGPAEWKLKLVSSSDGVKYDLVTHLDVPGHPNETTLRFLPSGEMLALVRREGGNRMGWLGRSSAPYKQWKWTEMKHQIGGPNFIPLPDGSLWAVCRSYPGGAKTVVAKMTADGDYEPLLTLPSGGDTSYAGLVWHDGLLWISYYSSHEGKTSIYLAKVKLPVDDKVSATSAARTDGAWEKLADGSSGQVTEFEGVGGVKVPAYIRKPAGDGPFPAIVMLHGGRYGKEATVGLGRSVRSPVADFVKQSWAVYSIDYRPSDKMLLPIEIEDSVLAVKALRDMPFIDRGRIGLMGGSHGANVSSRLVSRVDAAGAVLCAPAALDLIEVKKAVTAGKEPVVQILKRMIADTEKERSAMLEEVGQNPAKFGHSSAITEVAGARCPLLIINGRNDDNSPPSVIATYVAKLRSAGKRVETYEPDNGPHGFYFGRPEIPEWHESTRRAVAFFQEQFANAK